MNCGEPGAVKVARRVRRAAWGNGPGVIPTPRPRPTQPSGVRATGGGGRRRGVLGAPSGGIGGCPFAPAATGNIATQGLAYVLERSGDATGIQRGSLLDASADIESALQLHNLALLGRAGWFPPPN